MPMVPVYYCHLTLATQPINEPVTKIGGAPVFFQQTEWPLCRECSQPLQFLAQFRLDQPLPLARRYQMAYVFMCAECNSTYDPESGTNAVLLQSEDTDTFVEPGLNPLLEFTAELVYREEPVLDEGMEPETWDRLAARVSEETKIGGTPRWVQFEEIPACPQCSGRTNYTAQINELLIDPAQQVVTRMWDEPAQQIILEFGDAGRSYIFLCAKECAPRGAAFLWQCS